MTQPVLAIGIRRIGRHYPFPPIDVSTLPTNQWGSVNPSDLPADVQFLPSVTNVLGILDKPALLGWAAEQALRELYDSDAIPTDVEQAIERHKYACNRRRDERADVGTQAHTIAERLTTDTPLPTSISEEDEAYADAFMQFVADHDPQWMHVEVTVAHPKVGYAGTADWIATFGKRCPDCDLAPDAVVLGDYKTRGTPPDPKKVAKWGLLYDENRAQLAALAAAPLICTPGDTQDAPFVDAGMGVVLYPDGTYGHETLDLEELGRCFEGFKGALQAWRWKNGAAA